MQTFKVPETVWRAAKEQNSQLVTASVESWDWIHYLVEPSVVDYEYRGKEDDKACAENISFSFVVMLAIYTSCMQAITQ